VTQRDLRGLADQVGETTAFDRTIEVSTDVIAAVPFVGQIVATFAKQLVPSDHLIYLGTFAREVADRIERMDQEKVDRSYFDSEPWESDVGRVMDAIGQKRNRPKRAAYVAALANSAPTDRPYEVERHRFLDLLDALRPSHLRLLAVAVRAEATKEGGSIDDYMRAKLPNQDLENIRLDWADLERAGVFQGWPSGLATISTSERVWHALNAIGRRFAAFVEAVSDDEEPEG
jgi:hypothetical protein